MVNRKELAICKLRGHDALTIDDAWRQCKWCGLWLRKVITIEEREDAAQGRAEPVSSVE